MNHLEIELLAAELFPENKNTPLVLDPQAFLLNKNGILDADCILELQEMMAELLGSSCLMLINNEKVNAYAFQKEGTSVIALYAGAFKKLLYDASLMMLSDEFLPGIGQEEACYPDLFAEDYPFVTEDDENLSMTVSGDPAREAVGYMIAGLAVRFIVYHEIGHHVNGDVKKFRDQYGIAYHEALENKKEQAYYEERKRMEFEADMYAMDEIIRRTDYFMQEWGAYLGQEWGYSELYQLVVPALVLIKENLPVDVYVPEEIEKSMYLPNIIRISLAAARIFMDQEIKKVLYKDIMWVFQEDDAFREQFELENNLCVFCDDGQLSEMAYIIFCSLLITQTEHTYCKIFIGSSFETVFRMDKKIGDWFLHYYK